MNFCWQFGVLHHETWDESVFPAPQVQAFSSLEGTNLRFIEEFATTQSVNEDIRRRMKGKSRVYGPHLQQAGGQPPIYKTPPVQAKARPPLPFRFPLP